MAHGSTRSTLADPRREPALLPATLPRPLGTLADKLRFVRWAVQALRPVDRLLRRPDHTLAEDLDQWELSGPLRTGVVEPFLAGVVAEREGSTSANFAALLLRSFLLGTPSVPSLGVSRLPELMAARLPEGTVRLNAPSAGSAPPRWRPTAARSPAPPWWSPPTRRPRPP